MSRSLQVIATIALVSVAVYALMAGWSLVEIQLRLCRNQPIAARLKADLDREFPGVALHVGASYERDLIAVSASAPVESEVRYRLEQRMKEFKRREGIAAALLLRAPLQSGGQLEEQEF